MPTVPLEIEEMQRRELFSVPKTLTERDVTGSVVGFAIELECIW